VMATPSASWVRSAAPFGGSGPLTIGVSCASSGRRRPTRHTSTTIFGGVTGRHWWTAAPLRDRAAVLLPRLPDALRLVELTDQGRLQRHRFNFWIGFDSPGRRIDGSSRPMVLSGFPVLRKRLLRQHRTRSQDGGKQYRVEKATRSTSEAGCRPAKR
jgi:hypothetical protein